MFGGDDAYARQSLPLANEAWAARGQLALDDAQRRFPQVSFEGVRSVYFERETGYLLARQACRTVCEQMEREGGRFVRAAAEPGAIVSGAAGPVRLPDGSVLAADRYVFACGPWLGRLFPDLLGAAIRPTRQEAYFFGAPAGDSSFEPDRFPIWMDFGERRFYGFPNIDERGVKSHDDVRSGLRSTDGDRAPSLDGAERARAFLARRFPKLRDAPLIEARVCQYENSPDGHLILDRHPEAANVWIAGGGSGHGFKMSPALGEHMAGCVLGTAEPEPKFSIRRLAALNGRSTQFGHGD